MENISRIDLLKVIDDLKPHLMTSKEVKDYLGLSNQRLYRVTKEGRITPVLESYYLRRDIEEYKKILDEYRERYTPHKLR